MSHGLKERHSCLCCHFARQDFKVLSFDSANGQKDKWGGRKINDVSTKLNDDVTGVHKALRTLKTLYKFYGRKKK